LISSSKLTPITLKNLPWILLLAVLACQNPKNEAYTFRSAADAIPVCRTSSVQALNASLFPFLDTESPELVEINHWRYLPAGVISGLTPILPNDNRTPAGILNNNIREIDLEVKWGDFRPETPNRPGLKIIAMGETGKMPTVPSPLIRVNEGTTIRARVTNTLEDSTITVYGLQERPSEVMDSLFIGPGETEEVTFTAGKAGTYMYWARLGKGSTRGFAPEREQLAGAFVIDPPEGASKDRVFVMNIFSEPTDLEDAPFFESLTINGKSWPYTELETPELNEKVRWRFINATRRNHPMHLHGFYYDILEKGSTLQSEMYPEEEREVVVTDFMRPRKTMMLEWKATRPGKWLFHCHLSFHVSAEIRLPGANYFDPPGSHQHMAGLVIGVEIPDGESDLISKGEERRITLHANELKTENNLYAEFDFEKSECDSVFSPGPPLILRQYQPTYVTVENHMSDATSVHWHGLEIDSWSDGVPGWSSSEGVTSPMIEPGEEFEYKLTLMRPGTFVYHSHLDDINQLTKGLYGAIIVIGEDEEYNPEFDHSYMIGWNTPAPTSMDALDINGWKEIPVQKATVGETHKVRVVNIAPAGNVRVSVLKDSTAYPIKFVAKDGATIRESQQKQIEESQRFGVGEAADFHFTPREPGTYKLNFRFGRSSKQQTWIVTES
jgi:FtsP/CotA-like multicopper oxidase with cupredoxin domain